MRLRSTRMTAIASGVAALFNPARLFSSGEQGVWYDPSDMTTLFQDAAGTTPVTAVEQPVGRILDKSGRGNHATQTTAASRPVLSARYNLLTETEFRNGLTDAPTRGGLVSASSITGYQGAIAFGAGQDGYAYKAFAVPAQSNYTISAIVEMQDGNPPNFNSATASSPGNTFALVVIGGAASPSTYSVVPLGGGRFRVSATASLPTGGSKNFGIVKYATNDSRTFKATAYQLTVTNSLPSNAYQRVNTSTDYDTVGFKPYLRFDGVDDFLVTPSINFTGTDKMTVFAGVRKLSDAAVGEVVGLSSDPTTNAGAFLLRAPQGAATPGFGWYSYISTLRSAQDPSGSPAPITSVLTGETDFAAPLTRLRKNGVVMQSTAASAGTGNFGNYPLFIGRRAGTSLPFNGHLYSLIVRGAQSSDAQIRGTEAFVNSKTGAY